jgi:hypothetical protein
LFFLGDEGPQRIGCCSSVVILLKRLRASKSA